MISITDDETGQLLQFPDGTDESVIRAAIDRVRTGTHHQHAVGPDFSDVEGGADSTARRAPQTPQSAQPPQAPQTFDLSRLQREADRVAANPGTIDLSGVSARHPSTASTPPNSGPQPPPLHRSEDYWRSVTGSDNPEDWAKYARNAQLAETERGGTGAMSDAGFLDQGMYYENPQTGERYLKHHKSGTMPGPDAIDYDQRPGTIPAIKDVMSPEQANETREFVAGLPARVAGSVTGAVSMPVRAIEGVGSGLRAEIEDLANAGFGLNQSSGASFRRGFVQDWATNPVGIGADTIQRNVVDPARERLLNASIPAGDSPLGAAGIETTQMALGEAPTFAGMGYGIEALKGLSEAAPAVARAAELEAQGGARAIEDSSGIMSREFGRGSAPPEIAQRKLARDMAVPDEPWLQFDRYPNPTKDVTGAPPTGAWGWKGKIPDTVREVLGQPRRNYGGGYTGSGEFTPGVPLEDPIGPGPRPRSVERDPLPLPPVDPGLVADDGTIGHIGGLWDYASRRYPLLARQVQRIRINEPIFGGAFEPETGTMSLPWNANLGTVMHEFGHVAQHVRGQLEDLDPGALSTAELAKVEAAPTRLGDVYGRVPNPQPASVGRTNLVPGIHPFGTSDTDMLIGGIDHEGWGVVVAKDRTGMAIKGGTGQHDYVYELHRPGQPIRTFRGTVGDVSAEQRAMDTLREEYLASHPNLQQLNFRGEQYFGQPGDLPPSQVLQKTFPQTEREIAESERVRQIGQRLREALGQGQDRPATGPGQRLGTGPGNESGELVPLSKREYADAFNDDSTQPTGSIRSDGEARAYTAWLEKNGMNPDHVERFGESPELEQRFFDLHNPDIEELPPISASEQARIDRMSGNLPNGQPFHEQAIYDPEAAYDERGPRRLYAGGPPPAPAPPPLSEPEVARAMGWDVPPGSPRAISDPIRTADFQTNLAAQLGGGPESHRVAQYIVDNSDDVFRKIGPSQSWNTVEDMAARSGTTTEQFLRDNPRWSTLAPEERLRLTYIIKGNDQVIGDLQAKIVAGTASPEEQAELLRRIDTASDLVKIGAKAGSDYGRALNTLKIEARLALGDDQLLKQRLYRMYADQLDKQKPLMDSLARLNPGDQNELQAFLRQVNRPNFREYLHEFWVNSILATPIPFERKVIGDTIMMLGENGLVRPLSAVWDAARTMGPGAASNAEREVFLRETSSAFVGLGRGIREGLRRGLEVIRRGYDPRLAEGTPLFIPRSAFARAQNPFVRNIVGPVVTMPTRVISTATTVARTMNFTAELYAQAARIASKEELAAIKAGLESPDVSGRIASLVKNPTDEMLQAANKFAGRATFTDETSAIGKAITNWRDLPSAQPTNPVSNAALETYRAMSGFLLPFIHIADRLMVRGFEYTPMNFANAAGQRMAGNYAEAAAQAARASLGSIVMAYAASMAMEGRITGAAPKDEGERAAFYGANKQPWSIRTEGGTWIPYGHMQPIAMPLALVAAFYQGWKENPDDDLAGKITDGAVQVGTHVTDQSYLLALSKLMDVLHGGEQGRAGRAGSDLAASTTWGLVPYSGLVRTIARAVDPRVIDARSFSDRLTQNMPVASLGLNGKLDPWGEEVVPAGGRLRTVLASGTALLPTQEKANPLDQELDRLGMPLGYVGNNVTDHKKKIKLSDDEHFLYQQMAGRASKLLLQGLFAKDGYSDLDTETQRDEATKAIGAARKFARIVVLRYHNGAENYPGLNPSLGVVNWVNSTGTGTGSGQ